MIAPLGAAPAPAQVPGQGDRRNWVLFGVAVVLALLLGVTGTLLLIDRPGDTDQAAGSEPGTETPSTSIPADPAPLESDPAEPAPPSQPSVSEAELRAEVDDLSRFVEAQRGLEFREPVQVDLLDDDAFVGYLLDGFREEDIEDLELFERTMGALGLIPEGTDLVEAVERLFGEGVLGLYDLEDKVLVIRGGALTPYVRQTIVHELVHALDDQWFDLRREAYDDRLDEIGAGLLSVAEGNARRIEDTWVSTLNEAERRERSEEEARFAMGMDLRGIPMVLFEMLSAPYDEGQVFVDAIVGIGGEQAVNDAFVDPPDTTEQVMHPEKYLAREPRVEVALPPFDGELLDEGVFGERMLRIMLAERISGTEARQAAAGWGGDWYVVWEPEEGGTCVRVDFVMDTPGDLRQLIAALERYVFELPAATVENLGTDGVRLTSCTPDSPVDGGSAA